MPKGIKKQKFKLPDGLMITKITKKKGKKDKVERVKFKDVKNTKEFEGCSLAMAGMSMIMLVKE